MTKTVSKEDYIKAQKSRNLAIGLGLLAFVVLIFVISMVRTKQGLAIGNAQRAAAASSSNEVVKP